MPDIPGASELLDLDVWDAAEARWEWGRENLRDSERIEKGSTRDALSEAYEEILDCLNYVHHAPLADYSEPEHRAQLELEVERVCQALRDYLVHLREGRTP